MHTRNPSPEKLLAVAAANTVVMIVETMTTVIVSNIKWPTHKPTGFERPLDFCIACTADFRSLDT